MSAPASLAVVLLLITLGSVFVAAELALVSLRETQVAALAETGRRGRAVQRLVADPNRLLASVQIGVTLTAALSSAFGAVTLGAHVSAQMIAAGTSPAWAHPLGFLLVTLAITIATLVFGELAPKRLALQRSETVALVLAPFIERIAQVSRPAIWLLSRMTNAVVRLAGGDPSVNREQITEEELRGMVAATESLDDNERDLIDDVFGAGDRQVREVMVPRTEAAFLPARLFVDEALRQALTLPHSRYPVVGRDTDDIVGFVHLRDILRAVHDPAARHGRLRLRDIVRPAPVVPDSKPVLTLLAEMRTDLGHLAIVIDEFGGTAGIVTLEDLLEEVVGDIRDEFDGHENDPVELAPGVLDLDALTHLDEFEDNTGIRLPDGPYETVAGYVMNEVGRLPEVGDVCDAPGATIEVLELQGKRVAAIRVRLDTLTTPDKGRRVAADASATAAPATAAPDPAPADELPASTPARPAAGAGGLDLALPA